MRFDPAAKPLKAWLATRAVAFLDLGSKKLPYLVRTFYSDHFCGFGWDSIITMTIQVFFKKPNLMMDTKENDRRI